MAFVVAAVLMTLGAGGVLLSRKFAHVKPVRPSHVVTAQGAVEIASRRARWASFAVLASTVYQVVLSTIEGPWAIHRARLPLRVSALLALVAVVLYLRWLHRAVANTTLLRAPIKWTPRQAVAAYFIPIVSFFRPYQVMKALHAGSDPSSLHDAPLFRYRPAPNYRDAIREPLPPRRWNHPAPIGAWWALYTLLWVWDAGAGARFSIPVAFDCARAMDLVAAVLCALVIRSVDARQRERHRRLEASAA